jgi:cell shape-determining protein MreC
MSLAASTMEPNSSELEHLRNENNQLKKQLIEHEEKKRQVTPHLSYKLN